MEDGGRSGDRLTEVPADVLARLWRDSSGERFGFSYEGFAALVAEVAAANGWGVQGLALLPSNRVQELVLARACARGNEAAWESFLSQYRDILYRAACAITRQDAAGRELADSLYAELFGLTAHGEQRESKLASYTGRGSLAGWLRSVLAQRYVDEIRKSRRLVSIEDQNPELLEAMPESPQVDEAHRKAVAESIAGVLSQLGAEDRFLLNAYHLDGRNLADIARLLGVHESTISRRLKRLGKNLRKQLLRQLQRTGLSSRAAEEVLGGDLRDIDVNLRTLLQVAGEGPFLKEKAMEVQASAISAGEEG